MRGESAQSSVIGILLLVAVCVILASVVGVLALGFGDGLTTTQSACRFSLR